MIFPFDPTGSWVWFQTPSHSAWVSAQGPASWSPKHGRQPYGELGAGVRMGWCIDVKIQAVFWHSEFGVMHLENVLIWAQPLHVLDAPCKRGGEPPRVAVSKSAWEGTVLMTAGRPGSLLCLSGRRVQKLLAQSRSCLPSTPNSSHARPLPSAPSSYTHKKTNNDPLWSGSWVRKYTVHNSVPWTPGTCPHLHPPP